MDLKSSLILKLLGFGFLLTFISRMELADRIYQTTRGLPQIFADIASIIVIGIILYAAHELEDR